MPIYALGDQEPEIHPSAYIHPDAVVIGSVVIGAESSVWPCAVLRGDDGFIFIGERTSVQDGAVLHTTPFWPTTVGNEVTIGHLAHLEGCTVEDKALIGIGSKVLHNATVGREAIVGGGAFVGNKIFETVWDGGGTDTYDFSSYGTSVRVDLNPGAWTTTDVRQLVDLDRS
ncbi:MAG TPA: M10 family metallopeptidase C-terminal domain-containing protein, partial [Microthrixaceae bacterium]|nr:M10 family metallopeptidase C-terminal domain-containing protein [Microthrixaceae bacterium]